MTWLISQIGAREHYAIARALHEAGKLRAVVTDVVRSGVLVSPKGRWAKLDPFRNGNEGRHVNWTTSDALGDIAGQSTFHSNRVWIRKVA